jgi:hypothetical protein
MEKLFLISPFLWCGFFADLQRLPHLRAKTHGQPGAVSGKNLSKSQVRNAVAGRTS